MERNLQDVTFVIVDLETTGGAPFGGSEITEFGAVKVRGGEVIGEFSTFVRIDGAIPQFIVEMTGITDEMIADAPGIETVFPQFIEWVGSHEESVLIAHNAPFDISFLKAAALKLENLKLQDQLSLNSKNSNKPPSTDKNKSANDRKYSWNKSSFSKQWI